jgi:hypothetical protein
MGVIGGHAAHCSHPQKKCGLPFKSNISVNKDKVQVKPKINQRMLASFGQMTIHFWVKKNNVIGMKGDPIII